MKRAGLCLIIIGIVLLVYLSSCRKKEKVDVGLPYTTKEQLMKEIEDEQQRAGNKLE